jgi:hypothetical protein
MFQLQVIMSILTSTENITLTLKLMEKALFSIQMVLLLQLHNKKCSQE